VRLLFAKLRHIGDALLLTPTLAAVRTCHPTAKITVVVRKGTEGILAGCPAIDELHTTAPAERDKRDLSVVWNDLRLLHRLRLQRFDYAFDLTHADRGRLLVGFSRARHRCSDGYVYPPKRPLRWMLNFLSHADWNHVHRAQADWMIVNDALPLSETPPGPMVFSRQRTVPCDLTADQNTVIIHPATRWARKEWPIDRWVEVSRAFSETGRKVIVSVGPSSAEMETGRQIAACAGTGVTTTEGRLNWAQLAGLMHGAGLFVGVDTAAMHLAAACNLPSVALFHSRAQAAVWSPWKVHNEVLLPPGSGEGQMSDIQSAAVLKAAERVGGSPR